ncbi:MAG: MiaB/RimO family radical SAM methylthiotransferase [Desulfonauticus sp.]|nr:MiaB/RimO family radical SAM methylthiotransferase [Desulfonauticus sp.]
MNFNSFFIKTFGCKINQYETQALTEILIQQNKHPVSLSKAEVIILNTCAVTQKAITDLKKEVNYLNTHFPEKKIVLVGCACQVMGEKLALWKGVNTVVPQEKKFSFFQHTNINNVFSGISDYFRARAVLKIQDGCSQKCAYCIVPFTRGRPISRKPEEILNELKRLGTKNFQEITLSGINLHQYGKDLAPRIDFWDLIDFLGKNFDFNKYPLRLRLSSLEPADLNEKAFRTLKKYDFICPHLHISLQSGSDVVLKKMGRGHYQAKDVLEFCNNLFQIWPEFGLGVDVVVGFPGETDEYFEETCTVLHQLPLTYGHIFPYSPRPLTRAASFADQVPLTIKKQRAFILRTIIAQKKSDFLRKLLKLKFVQVIVENSRTGTTEHYVKVKFISPVNVPPRSLVLANPIELRIDNFSWRKQASLVVKA